MKVFLLFFGCAVLTINSEEQPQCKTLILKPNTIYYSSERDYYLLEGDEDDYKKMNHIDQQIIQKSFVISYKEKPISIQIINSINGSKIYENLMCFLQLQEKYIITCISLESIYFGEENSQLEKIKIITNIESSQICDDIYYQKDQGFLIICLDNSILKEYLVNLEGEVVLVFQYDVSIQIQDLCKKQQRMQDKQFIFIFYQCSKWKVFQNDFHEVKILLEADLIPYQELQFVEHVQFCEKKGLYFFYLIEKYSYIYCIMDSSGQIRQIFLNKSERLIMKLILLQTCSTFILITNSLKDSESQYPSKFEISYHQNYSANNIHFYSDFLFLQNKSELILIVNPQINQTYTILNNSIFFLQSYNLFYQIDQENNNIQFYRYRPIGTLIKPKRKYLFAIQNKGVFYSELAECWRINYQDLKEDFKRTLFILTPCFLDTYIMYIYDQMVSLNQSSIQLFKNGNNIINISIWNVEKVDQSCLDKLKKQRFGADYKLKFISKEVLIIFEDDFFIYLFDCESSKILLKMYRNDTQVFQSYVQYYFYDATINIFRIIQVINNRIHQYLLKIDVKITTIQQFYNILVLHLVQTQIPMLLDMNYNKLNYLSKQLFQPEEILFYKEIKQIIIIQYKNILAIEYFGEVKCFQFTEGLIIEVFSTLSRYYQVLAIQNTTNSLLYYYFDLFEIHQLSNSTLFNYSISNPLTYLRQAYQFIILLEKGNQTYLTIYQITHSEMILFEIIQTSDSFFIYFENGFLYHDSNQQLKLKYFNNITIQIQSKQMFLNGFFTTYHTQLNLTSSQKQKKFDFQFLIQNDCNNLYAYSNNTQIQLQKGENIHLKISQYLYGPIDRIQMKNASLGNLKGPIQLNERLVDCTIQYHQYCFKEFSLFDQNSKLKLYSFQALILENQIILQQLKHEPQQLYLKTLWFKDSFYMLFIQKFEELSLLLVALENEIFIEISKLIINFPTNLATRELSKIGNIISIDFNQTYFFISNLTINQIKLPDQILDISEISNTQDHYIIVNGNLLIEQDLEILIVQIINFTTIQLLYKQIITEELILLFDRTNQYLDYKISDIKQIKFNKCQQNGKTIVFNLFVIFEQFSFSIQSILDIEDHIIQQFDVLQCFQNQGEFNSLDNNLLILKQMNPLAYVYYDLRGDYYFQNYIYKTSFELRKVRLNTTHYVFINESDYYIGKFGYEIEFYNLENNNINLVLEAQNQVSSIELTIQISVNLNDLKMSGKSVIIILLNFIIITTQIKMYQRKRKSIMQIGRSLHN